MEKLKDNKQSNAAVADQVGRYVTEFFKTDMPENLLFHNISHTKEVVNEATELAVKSALSEEDIEILTIAAWFHDTGYAKKREGHEEESVNFAWTFLEKIDYGKKKTNKVLDLIRSTRQKHYPKSLAEEILHDADLSNIGKKRFFRQGELLRAELEVCCNETFSELDWQKKQYDFLVNNTFLTIAGKKKFAARRAKNIKKQRENIISAKKVTRRMQTGKDFGRGIDTLYRSNYRNHINFSAIADGKANMMISINTILISVIVTLSGASLSIFKGFQLESVRYTIPILILLVSSLISVVFAVLSARPKVTEKRVRKKDVIQNKMSLLYFGNFLEISKDEFTAYLAKLKNDQQELYDSMSMDIYNLGSVLKEKYRLLSISYTVFMFGLSLCVLGFITLFIISNF